MPKLKAIDVLAIAVIVVLMVGSFFIVKEGPSRHVGPVTEIVKTPAERQLEDDKKKRETDEAIVVSSTVAIAMMMQ